MKNFNIILMFAAALLTGACAGPEARLNTVSVEVTSAGKKHDVAELARLSASISAEDMSPGRLAGYSDETLNILFATLRKIAFYSPDQESYALRLRSAFAEKIRRGKQTASDIEELYTAFMMSGLFNEAAAFRLEFPASSLPEVPEIVAGNNVTPSGWQIYKISADARKAGLQPLAKDGPLMIMAMHPGCEFAEMASEVIFADPVLGPVFHAKGFMLTRKFEPDGVAEIKK